MATTPTRVDADGFRVFEQDPGAVVPYALDFNSHPTQPYLRVGETLLSVVWAVSGSDALLLMGDGGATVATPHGTETPAAPAFTGTVASVTLYGGTVGVTYTVTAKFKTQGLTPPVIDERSFRVTIKDR